MHNFMKKRKEELALLTEDELFSKFSFNNKKSRKVALAMLSVLILTVTFVCISSVNKLAVLNIDDESNGISLAINPIAATSSRKNVLTIPSGIVKANPFVPYRSLGDEVVVPKLIDDVPKFDLIAPPEVTSENAAAAKIMDTVVSGILFDKYSPSAILNIDGTDYLVKKGDVVNNYKVLAIAQDSVTVQLGKNTYKAGIGEILTEGTLNHNDISNLGKKFGGEQR